MQARHENVINKLGNAVGGARVTVKTLAGAIATIYEDNGVTQQGNPVRTDDLGYYRYYVADGRYTEEITGPGLETVTITDILFEDVSDGFAALAASSGASLVGFIQDAVGAVARTLLDKIREMISITPEDFGAVGDGVTDDAVALQLFVDHVVSNGLHGYLPNKTYLTSAPLSVGTVSPAFTPFNESSFVIEGSAAMYVSGRGCRIKLTGTGHDSIITINKGASRWGTFRGFTLECETAPASDVYAAENGIKFATIFFSQFSFQDIRINNARKVIGIYAGGGANGEFTEWKRVTGGKCQKYFYMDSGTGQAYGHTFHDCGWGGVLSQGSSEYVAFEMGSSGGGYGINVKNFVGSITNDNATTTLNLPPIIYFRDNGANGPISFEGGRVEGLTTIVDSLHTSAGIVAIFENLDFAGVYSSANNPTFKSATNAGAPSSIYSFKNCAIPIAGGTDGRFYIAQHLTDNAKYIFEDCQIAAYDQTTAVPFVVAVGRKQRAEVRFSNCSWKPIASTPDQAFIALNRVYRGGGLEDLPRNQFDGHNNPLSGVPDNLLQYPHFGAAAPTAPWVASGNFANYQGPLGANLLAFSSSPVARWLQMASGMTVYQDVLAITATNQFLYYVACLHVSIGNTADRLQISLLNDTTGELYDMADLGANTGSAPFTTQTIRLVARSTGSTGSFRLKWEAPSANTGNVTIRLSWQLCSRHARASFVQPADGSTKTYQHDWHSMDMARVFGRFALPYKNDATGAQATTATLAELESDMYLSTVNELVRYFANSAWHAIPQSRVNTTAVGNVGGGEDDLMTATVAARTLVSTGHTITVDAYGTVANNANPKTIKLKFGTQDLANQALTVSQVGKWHIHAEIARTGSNTQDWVMDLVQSGTAVIDAVDMGTATQTDTSAITIKCTGTVTDGGGGINNNDIVQEYMRVTYAD